MRRGVLAAAVGVLLVGLVVTACTGDEGGPGFSVPAIGPADVDVDTPELRAAKEVAGIEPCPTSDAPPVEGGLPEVTLECFGGGREVDLAGLRGPMVVSVWAQWCEPCRQEMPVLQTFHEEHGDEVALVGIDYQDPQAGDAMDFISDRGATYPQLADPGSLISGRSPIPRLNKLPFLAFVDADGVVTHRAFEVVESPDQLRDLVEEHLGVAL